MTDRTIPTDEDRRIARDWAAHIIRAPYTSMPMESVAARVILDAVPAPPPKRPTLADMPPEERAACQWMQADVTIQGGRYVIVDPCDMDGEVGVVFEGGEIAWLRPECVTPRPDLPRMTWPGDQQPTPAPSLPGGWRLAEHRKYGRVVVTNPTPDVGGHVYFVSPAPSPIGNDWHLCTPDELKYLDQEADTAGTVPESTLAVGSEWNDADALARACRESGRDQIVVSEQDGYAFVWDGTAEWWEGSAPPQTAPLTILHTGREADQ